MAERRLVADIRRHRGDTNYIVELVGRFSPGAAVDWLVRPDQAHLLPPEHIIGQAESSDRSGTSRICEHLVQSVRRNGTQNHAGSGFWVLSYDNHLLAEVCKLNLDGLTLTTQHLSELFRLRPDRQPTVNAASHLGRSNFRPTGTTSAISLDAAVALAKSVLVTGGHTSRETALPQKDLRIKMAFLDQRLKKSADPSTSGLLSEVVDIGMQTGWLKRFRRIPLQSGTEFVYAEIDTVSGATASTSTAVTSAAIPSRAGLQELSIPLKTPSKIEAPADSSIDVPNGSPGIPSAKTNKHRNRATDFEAILSKSRIGSLPETRELIFDGVEQVVAGLGRESILLPELFARAVAVAQQKAEEDGFVGEKKWAIAERCIRRLMMWTGVLIDRDGQAVPDKIGANASQIQALAPDFRRLCEAFLAERIIAETASFKYDDDPYYLGLTLYRRGRQKAVSAEELKAKADGILMHLEKENRIEMGPDRVIRVKLQPKKMLALPKQNADDGRLSDSSVRIAQPN